MEDEARKQRKGAQCSRRPARLEADDQHQAADDFKDNGRPDQDAGHAEHFHIADIELDRRDLLEARNDEDQRQQNAPGSRKISLKRSHGDVSGVGL